MRGGREGGGLYNISCGKRCGAAAAEETFSGRRAAGTAVNAPPVGLASARDAQSVSR